MKRIITINKRTACLLLTSCSLLLASCGNNTNNETEKSVINKAFIKNIQTVKAELKSQEEELVLTGKVDYDPDKLVNYIPLVSGVVERTYFSLDDKVQKGQVLADFKSMELNTLKSELATLESELSIAARKQESVQAMYADNMASEKELLEAMGKVKQTKAEIEKASTSLSMFGPGKTDGTFGIRAPMTGYIVLKTIASGSPVSGDGEPLFTVADLSTVWIIANVYAGNLPFVKEGMPVTIKVLSYPGELFMGKINTLSQVFHPEEKVLKARIVMPNPELKLKPEMAVDIRLKNNMQHKLVSIPSDALIFDNDRYFVVVEESTENFKIREVSLQGHNNGTTYITSGLSAGDKVVVKNQLLVYNGLKE